MTSRTGYVKNRKGEVIMKVEIIEPEVTKFNNWPLEKLEKEFNEQYPNWDSGGGYYSEAEIRALSNLIRKRKTQQQLKKLFDEVI